MCGIIGYVGPRACKPLLLQGLERLEYRGYDSAGLALLETDGLEYIREVGNLQKLKRKAESNRSGATTGVGHTRWATHGRVSMENAHPLTGCDDGAMSIVLNGIVENYRELKESLVADGHTFSSETDAEVVSHLIERYYEGDLVAAFRAGVRRSSRGTSRSSPSTATTRARSSARAARRRSSSASATGEMFLASSIAAFLHETRRVQFIDDNQIVELTPAGAIFHGVDGAIVEPAGHRDRLGRGERREVRLRDVHAQGDLRAARSRARDDRRPRPRPPAVPRRGRHDRARDPEPAPDRDRRLRHRLPRGRRRPVHPRGVGAPAGRAGRGERVDLPQPGGLQGHARDRDLAVGRDARHRQRDEARPRPRRAHARDHQPDGHADHARGGRGALHALRPRDRRRRLEDLHRAGRAPLADRAQAGRAFASRCRRSRSSSSSTGCTSCRRRCRSSSTATTRSTRSRSATTRSRSSSTSGATSACRSRSKAR